MALIDSIIIKCRGINVLDIWSLEPLEKLPTLKISVKNVLLFCGHLDGHYVSFCTAYAIYYHCAMSMQLLSLGLCSFVWSFAFAEPC